MLKNQTALDLVSFLRPNPLDPHIVISQTIFWSSNGL